MAFDRTNPADLQTLQDEVNLDPIGMGYASAQNTSQLVKLLNDPDSNVGGETASRYFDPFALMDALDPTDYESPQTVAGTPNYVHTLVELAAYGDISPYRDKFKSMFAANSATVTALDAQNVTLSRAEVLFGQGTILSFVDWYAARDYTP